MIDPLNEWHELRHLLDMHYRAHETKRKQDYDQRYDAAVKLGEAGRAFDERAL